MSFCTVTEIVNDKDQKLKEIKFKLDSTGSEITLSSNDKELNVLKDTVNLNIIVMQNYGQQMTIDGRFSLNKNIDDNLTKILKNAKLKKSDYKFFHNYHILDTSQYIDKIYEPGKDMKLVAFYRPFKLRRWNRFPTNDCTGWENIGQKSDGIIFVPNQKIRLAGFVSFSAQNDSEYELKYELKIDGILVEKSPKAKYDDWKDTYYKNIMFKDLYKVSAKSSIQITIWISKSFSSNSESRTYYGRNGINYAKVKNQDMDLFTVKQAE